MKIKTHVGRKSCRGCRRACIRSGLKLHQQMRVYCFFSQHNTIAYRKFDYFGTVLDHFGTLLDYFVLVWSGHCCLIEFRFVFSFCFDIVLRWSVAGRSPKHRWQCLIDWSLKVNSAKGSQENTQSLIKMMYLYLYKYKNTNTIQSLKVNIAKGS